MSKNFSLNIVLLFVVFFCPNIATIASGANATDNTDQTLSKLENRFFEHQYANDTDTDRLNRLDQFVFGCNQTGSASTRLQHLASTVPDETADKINGDTNTDAANTGTSNTSTNNQVANNNPTNSNDNSSTDNNISDADTSNEAPAGKAFAYSSYPSVTTLEQELLGHTYANDTLAIRLARLETKAFGTASTSNDLSKRVDSLEDYAQRNDIYNARNIATTPTSNAFPLAPFRNRPRSVDTTNQNVATNTDSSAMDEANPFKPHNQEYISKTGSFVNSIEERVSMMEAQQFGHTYPDKPLDKRLKKLESKVLPNQDDSKLGIFERTGKLWVAMHPADKAKVDNLLASNEIVNNRIVDKGSVDTSNTDAADASSTNSNVPSNPQTTKRNFWLNKLGNAIGSPNQNGNQGPDANQSFAYPYPGTYTYGGESSTPAGYYRRSYGASIGPGSGPAGLPVGFW